MVVGEDVPAAERGHDEDREGRLGPAGKPRCTATTISDVRAAAATGP